MIRGLLIPGLLLLVASPAPGQTQNPAAGVVLRQGAPPVPVRGVRVVLHRIGRATQGPIDTVVTGADGRFGFRYAVDTTANYLLSANYAGIEYFSQPLTARPGVPDTGLSIVVFDTSSTTPVVTRSRTVVIGAPDPIGLRTVIDWLVFENRTGVTRINVDSLDPTWSAPLPPEARNPSLGDSRTSVISPDALIFRNDSVGLLAPVSPGGKEVLLQYEFSGETSRVGYDIAGVDSVEVFLEESGAAIVSPGWQVADSQRFEGRSFRRFRRSDPGAALTITFPRRLGREALPLLVALTALVLVGVTWWRFRRPAGPARS